MLGAVLLIWTSLGFIPLGLGVAILLGHVHGKWGHTGAVLVAAIGAGGLLGFLLPWDIVIIAPLLIITLLSSWAAWKTYPSIKESAPTPVALRYSLALLAALRLGR